MAGLAIATRLGGPGAVAAPPAAAPATRPRAEAAPAAATPEGFAPTLLPRHGRRPLGFSGRLLVQAGITTDARGTSLPVASQVALYETEAGGMVAAIRHAQPGQDLPPLTYAEPFADGEALKDWLGAHDPLADLPVHALLPADAEALPPLLALAAAGHEMARIRAAFRALLAALLTPIPDGDQATDRAGPIAAHPHPTRPC